MPHHIIVHPTDELTLCGLIRDLTVPQGTGRCKDCIEKLLTLAERFRSAPTFEPITTAQKEKKSMALEMKAVVVKSLKQGASIGAIKAARKKLVKIIAKKYPAIHMLPHEVQDLALCFLIGFVAKQAPELPAVQAAESVASMAIEGMLTATVSKMIEEFMDQVGPLLTEIAESAEPAKLK